MSRPSVHEPAGFRLAVIDGLRGLAIIAVVHHHTSRWLLGPAQMVQHPAGPFVWSPYTLLLNGWIGVNLFFVLSGFVLMLPFASGQRRLHAPRDVGRFYAHRAARLLPLYYLFVLVAYFVGSPTYSDPEFFPTIARMLTFAYTFDRYAFFPPINIALWSIAVEVGFSVLFPFLFLLGRKIGFVPLLGLSLAFSLAVRVYAIATHDGGPGVLLPVKDGIGGRLDDFVVGMLLAHFHANGLRLSAAKALASLACGFLLVLACCLAWDNVYAGRIPYWAGAGLHWVPQAAFALIVLGALGELPRVARSALTVYPLRLAGCMSYSIYIWHTGGHLGPGWSTAYTFHYVALCLVLAAFTYRYVEFPRRTFRGLFLLRPGRP